MAKHRAASLTQSEKTQLKRCRKVAAELGLPRPDRPVPVPELRRQAAERDQQVAARAVAHASRKSVPPFASERDLSPSDALAEKVESIVATHDFVPLFVAAEGVLHRRIRDAPNMRIRENLYMVGQQLARFIANVSGLDGLSPGPTMIGPDSSMRLLTARSPETDDGS